ncbi:MAG: hypothetical protein JW750_12880 [Anaerolineaceae bacterium]|nr:hypothetical protein [Anaerolineaceae bacterium]
MSKSIKFIMILIILTIFSMVFSACAPESQEPTVDANMIYTEAAKTVAAQLTAEAEKIPPTETPTEVPPTATATEVPPTEMPTETPVAETPTPAPTATAARDKLIDQASFSYFYPPDQQVYNVDGRFDAKVGFINAGPNTWNSSYSMRFLSGSSFGAGSKYTLEKYGNNLEVAPGEEVIITIPNMKVPSEPGEYSSNWCFYNNREDQGLPPQCFYLVTFNIIVK